MYLLSSKDFLYALHMLVHLFNRTAIDIHHHFLDEYKEKSLPQFFEKINDTI